MLRTSKVTFTATAVTLACLAGALYASPVVVAETMGRDITAYSPMDHSAFTQNRHETTLQAHDAGAAREESSMTHDGTWETVESDLSPTSSSESATTDTQSVGTVATAPDINAEATVTEPSDTSTSRVTSESPQIDVTLPESQETEATTEPPASAETSEDLDESMPDDMDSPDSITVIVNKLRALPADYAPEDLVELSEDFTDESEQLREEAAAAAEELFAAAQQDDIELRVVSSFRSYDYQQQLYDNYQEQYGDETTNKMSARPGHSEHQTGLALDVDTPQGEHTLETSFGQTEAGQWLADHGHEYGFVIRYPDEQQDITGFQYEPWHLRYFGEQYATHIMENSGVAEKEFGLKSAPDYQD